MENKNGFQELLTILLSRGFSYLEIKKSLEEKIISEYEKTNPKPKETLNFILNENDGSFGLFKDGSAVNDQVFLKTAEKIINEELIRKIQQTDVSVQTTGQTVKDPRYKGLFLKILFGFYNFIFFALILFTLASFVFLSDSRQDITDFFKEDKAKIVVAFLLFSLPILSCIFAFKKSSDQKRIFNDGKSLSYLLFLFEIPLILAFFWILSSPFNVTPTHLFFLTGLLFTVLSFPLQNFKMADYHPALSFVDHGLRTFSFLAFLYPFLIYLLFFPIILSANLQMVFDFFKGAFSSFDDLLRFVLFSFPFSFFFFIILTLTVSPFLLLKYFYQSFRGSLFSLEKAKGQKFAYVLTSSLVFVFLLIFFVFNFKSTPDDHLLKLEKISENLTFEEKQSLAKEALADKEIVKKEIEGLNLAKQTYFFSKGDEFVKELYEDNLDLGLTINSSLNETFLSLAYPFVYNGTLDPFGNARENYFYLTGIRLAHNGEEERPSIGRNEKNVSLVSRVTKVKTDYEGLLAEVSVTDEFINKTDRGSEEVIYEFYLPEGSVIEKLSLGPNLEFPGIIAPRGAANKVYDREVQKAKDPAVLEELSPGKYRLRIFPIPRSKGNASNSGGKQKVSFTYTTPLLSKGYSLPVYFLKDNLSDDQARNETYVDEKPISIPLNSKYVKKDNFERDLCQLNGNQKLRSQSEYFSAEIVPYQNIGGLSEKITCSKEKGISFKETPSQLKVAILYDVSLSNKEDSFLNNLKETLKTNPNLFKENDFDLYFFNDSLSRKKTLKGAWTEEDPIYFSQSYPVSALEKLSEPYDLIILATSSKEFAEGEDKIELKIQTPIYFISDENLNFPTLPKNLSYVFYKNRGTFLSDFESALNRFVLAQKQSFPEKNLFTFFGPNWAIKLLGEENVIFNTEKLTYLGEKEGDTLSYLTSRSHFLKLMGSSPENLSFGNLNSNNVEQFKNIDKFHDYAKVNHIVTPFSSLISLVNEKQLDALKKASDEVDRFSYEEATPSTNFDRLNSWLDETDWENNSFRRGAPFQMNSMQGKGSLSPEKVVSNPLSYSSPRSSIFEIFSGYLIFLFLVLPIGIFLLSGIVISLRKKIKERKTNQKIN